MCQLIEIRVLSQKICLVFLIISTSDAAPI
jgi:hypothetical protein